MTTFAGRCQQTLTIALSLVSLEATLAASARASDAVSLTASISGAAITVTATGTADPCPYCLAGQNGRQLVIGATEVTSSYPSCPDSPNAGPLTSVNILDAGGAVSTTATFPVRSGTSYRVCAGIEQQEASTFESLAEAPFDVLAVPPAACPAGTRPALSVRLPARVVRGRSYLVTIRRAVPPLSLNPPVRLLGDAGLGVLNLMTDRYVAARTITHARLSKVVTVRLPGLRPSGRYELILAGEQSELADPAASCDQALTRRFRVAARAR